MAVGTKGNPLKSLHVAGFKSLQDVTLNLHRLNLLIGANGVGKSNFIQVFRLLNHLVEKRLQLYVGQSGGADNLFHFGQKATATIEVDLSFGPNTYSCSLVPSENDGLVFQKEECTFEKQRTQGIWTEDLGSGHAESTLSERATYRPVVSYVLDGLGSWIVYHFHDTSDSARVRKACDLADNKRLRPDASNLAAFLYLLQQKHPGEYRNIVDTIRLTAPFLDDFVLEPDRLKPDSIRLAWRHTQSDRYFGPHTLSDGTLRFTCLATLLLQPDLPTTILMDEPELGLHPQAIGLLAELMKAAATRTQIVVATQSVTLVNHFEPKDIVVVEQQSGRSLFRRLSDAETSDWLDDYGVGDLWEKNLLGGRP